jgi:head-tail adaptor
MQIELNRKLVLESPSDTSDGAGGNTIGWDVLGPLWANIKTKSASARSRTLGEVSQTRLRIIIRGAPVGSLARPKPDQRFREGARIYRIDAVSEYDASGLYLECWATEEVLQ